jgi:hypothetical protein
MFTSGTSTDYLALLETLNSFLCDQGSAFAVTPNAGNTGNGRVTAFFGSSGSVAEVFTLTASNSTTFSVVGSVSGSLGNATVGTPFTSTKVNFTLVAGSAAFVSGDSFLICTAPKWTALSAPVTATSTRWRIRITASGNVYSGITVARIEMATSIGGTDECTGGTASASSVYSTHTADLAFDTQQTTYWQPNGVPAWIEYEFATTKAIKEVAITQVPGAGWSQGPGDFTVEYWNGSSWIVAGSYQHESGSGAGPRRTYPLRQYVWQAPGNDGTAEILVGVHPFSNADAGWFNWRLQGFTGHAGATVSFFEHPGAINDPQHFQHGPALTLWNQSMDYWLWANGRRAVIVVKVGTTYQAAYLGLIQPFASPGQWPYPLAVGGSLAFYDEPVSDDTTWRYNNSSWERSNFPISRSFLTGNPYPQGYDGQAKLRVRAPDGSWLGFLGYNNYENYMGTNAYNTLWPYAHGLRNLKANLDGSVPVFPIMLHRRATPVNAYGVLDGVFATSGAAGVSAESVITVGYDQFLVFPDGSRSGAMDYFAVRED